MKNPPSIFDIILREGFIEVDSPLEKNLLEETVYAYREFDRVVPEQIKGKTYMTLHEEKRVRLGQKEKTKDEGKDNKSYFHFHPDLQNYVSLPNCPEYLRFFEAMNEVYLGADKIVNQFMNSMREMDLVKEDWNQENPLSIIRILNYKPIKSEHSLADIHKDRGTFTATLYETHDGLTFYPQKTNVKDNNGKPIPVQYEEGVAKIFPSNDWSSIFKRSANPLFHEVVQHNTNSERSSIVVFNNACFK